MPDWLRQFLRVILGDDLYFRIRMAHRLRAVVRKGKPLVFVHQVDKVGSLSVLRELKRKRQWPGATPSIYHTHHLSYGGIRSLHDLQAKGHGGWGAVPAGSRRFIAESRAFGAFVGSGRAERAGCHVVSLVRDPVAVNLSGFFHNAAWWPRSLSEACGRRAIG